MIKWYKEKHMLEINYQIYQKLYQNQYNPYHSLIFYNKKYSEFLSTKEFPIHIHIYVLVSFGGRKNQKNQSSFLRTKSSTT